MSWVFFFPSQFSISPQANPAAAGRGSAADLGRGRSALGVAWILSDWSQEFQMQQHSSLLMGTQKLLSDSKEKEKQGYGHHEAQMRRAEV